MPCNSEYPSGLYIRYCKHNAQILNYWSVVYLFIDKVHLGTDSKWRNKNTLKFHLIPAYIKAHTKVRKNIVIMRYISEFISLIYFSIEMTINI